jgi:uncharacterized protein (TIGR02996 family)
VSERDAFMAAILANPADDVSRLVYADFLEEYGERDRAEFIRTQYELERLRAEQTDLFNDETDWHRCTGISATWCPNCGDCSCREPEFSRSDDDCPIHAAASPHCCAERVADRIEDAREREAELFNPDWLPDFGGQLREWYFHTFPNEHRPDRPFSFVVRRGFAAEVQLSCADFLAHAEAIFRAHPVTGITLVDRMHPYPAHGGRWTWWNAEYSTYWSAGVPYPLFGNFPDADGGEWHWHDDGYCVSRSWPTSDLALTALSRACVAYGRKLAGLSGAHV